MNILVLFCFRYLTDFVLLMKPIAVTLDKLQGDVTYGYLMPIIISLRNNLNDLITSNKLQCCSPLVPKLIEGLETRFKKIFCIEEEGRLAAIAAFMHPLFKEKWLYCLEDSLQKKIRSIVLEAMKDHVVPVVENPSEIVEDEFFNFGSTDNVNIIDRLFGETPPQTELLNFLKERRTDYHMPNSYPTVRELFLKSNTPTPSSASTERMFNRAKMTDLPQYNRLSATNFEIRVVSRANSSRNFNWN